MGDDIEGYSHPLTNARYRRVWMRSHALTAKVIEKALAQVWGDVPQGQSKVSSVPELLYDSTYLEPFGYGVDAFQDQLFAQEHTAATHRIEVVEENYPNKEQIARDRKVLKQSARVWNALIDSIVEYLMYLPESENDRQRLRVPTGIEVSYTMVGTTLTVVVEIPSVIFAPINA